MSKNSKIHVYTINRIESIDFINLLKSLLNENWTLNKSNHVFYMINGSYDYKTDSYKNVDNVISAVTRSICSCLETSIDLVYSGTNINIELKYINSNEISIRINEDEILEIEDLKIADFSWYLKKIKPIFDHFEYLRIVCLFD